jgi:sigma-B regulation protein RsbU (phosphoserine phosphatase)
MVVELPDAMLLPPRDAVGWTARRQTRPGGSEAPAALLAQVEALQQQLIELSQERNRLAAEARGLRKQVRAAAAVQREMLPDEVRLAGAKVATLYRPVDRVSGDVLCVETDGADGVAIGLADVSGHGLPAGMLTPLLSRSLRGVRADDGGPADPSAVLDQANRDLLALDLEQGQFATALSARYDSTTRELRYARAGHPPAILLREGMAPRRLAANGMVLGAMAAVSCPTESVALQPGDRVLVFSDGLEALLCFGDADASAGELEHTAWYRDLAEMSADAILADVSARLGRAAWCSHTADDVALIVLTVTA